MIHRKTSFANDCLGVRYVPLSFWGVRSVPRVSPLHVVAKALLRFGSSSPTPSSASTRFFRPTPRPGTPRTVVRVDWSLQFGLFRRLGQETLVKVFICLDLHLGPHVVCQGLWREDETYGPTRSRGPLFYYSPFCDLRLDPFVCLFCRVTPTHVFLDAGGFEVPVHRWFVVCVRRILRSTKFLFIYKGYRTPLGR